MPDQMFSWHHRAVLTGPDGSEVTGAGAFRALVPERSATAALGAVMAGAGQPFRIGGTGALEAPFGCFEALTGGSLGTPRRIIRTQSSWIASFMVNAGLFGIGPGVGTAVLGRLTHSLALYGALEGVHLGARVHVLDGVRPDRQAQALSARGVSVLYATPAQLHGLVGAGRVLPRLRHVVIGGAMLDAVLHGAVQRLAPDASIHVFYGAAEASFITLATGAHATVGHPYPGVEVRLLTTAGHEGNEGEIWVRSPYLFVGYAGADRGSAAWRDGWLGLGEIGMMTPEGLVLRGRAGRMVTIADRNVFPEEIEAFLVGLPGVGRVAVVPVTDPARGAVLLAFAQGDRAQEPTVMATARAELGPMVAPKAMVWLDHWPELPSGKTDLGAVAQRAAAWR